MNASGTQLNCITKQTILGNYITLLIGLPDESLTSSTIKSLAEPMIFLGRSIIKDIEDENQHTETPEEILSGIMDSYVFHQDNQIPHHNTSLIDEDYSFNECLIDNIYEDIWADVLITPLIDGTFEKLLERILNSNCHSLLVTYDSIKTLVNVLKPLGNTLRDYYLKHYAHLKPGSEFLDFVGDLSDTISHSYSELTSQAQIAEDAIDKLEDTNAELKDNLKEMIGSYKRDRL